MNVDHYFTIGSAHMAQGNPCEDYALSGALADGTVYGVVADGCSGANANTDVGARAISWAFKRALEQHNAKAGQWLTPGFQGLLQAAFAGYQYEGARNDYLATVVGFVATPEQACVYVHGDGAVALRYTDGRLALIEFEWAGNMPFYLNYQLHPALLNDFVSCVQSGGSKPLCQRTTTLSVTDTGVAVLDTKELRFSVDEVLAGRVLHFQPEVEGIVALAVLTDGIEQVGTKPAAEVATEFLAFKNHQGEFVKRRLLRALKTWHKDGIAPRDDVGMAAVWFVDKE